MDVPNPYQAPHGQDGARAAAVAGRPLFGLMTIALATLIGTALAGMWLVSMNYAAQGRVGTAWVIRLVIEPVLLIAAIVAFGYGVNALERNALTVVLLYLVMQPAALYLFADWAQGGAIRARAAAGAPARSMWLGASIALLFLLAAGLFPIIVMGMFAIVGLVEAA